MSFRNIFQKDIDNNTSLNNFSFNLTQGKLADQRQNISNNDDNDDYGENEYENEIDNLDDHEHNEEIEDNDALNISTNTNNNLDEEKRRKNLEASIRFRIKRKNRLNHLQNQIKIEDGKIEDFKTKLHKLEIENACLRKMLLGNWDPKCNSSNSENSFSNDSNLLNSTVNNISTNSELLQLLKKTSTSLSDDTNDS